MQAYSYSCDEHIYQAKCDIFTEKLMPARTCQPAHIKPRLLHLQRVLMTALLDTTAEQPLHVHDDHA